MKTMLCNQIKTILILLVLGFTILSCNKDEPEPVTIVQKWNYVYTVTLDLVDLNNDGFFEDLYDEELNCPYEETILLKSDQTAVTEFSGNISDVFYNNDINEYEVICTPINTTSYVNTWQKNDANATITITNNDYDNIGYLDSQGGVQYLFFEFVDLPILDNNDDPHFVTTYQIVYVLEE